MLLIVLFHKIHYSFSLVTFKAAIQELLTLKPEELRPRSDKVHRELRLEDLMKVSENLPDSFPVICFFSL